MIVLIIGGIAGMEALARWSASPWATPEWEAKRAGYLALPQPPAVIFTGDSTVSVGARPQRALPGAYNLGRSALVPGELGTLDQELRRLGTQPTTIYLYISPDMLFRVDGACTEPLDERLRLVGAGLYSDPNLLGLLFLPGHQWARQELGGLASEAAHPRERTFTVRPDGSRATLASWSQDPEAEPESMTHPASLDPVFLSSLRRRLDQFIASSASRGAKVVWLGLPMHPRHRQMLLTRFPEHMAAYAALLANCFGARRIELGDCLQPSDFADGLHFTEAGTERLNEVLRDRLPKEP